jgi:hypothetical protein
MQVVIIEQAYDIVDRQIRHNWTVQQLGTGKVVARIWEDGNKEYRLLTYGDHPSGNRYRTFETMERVNDVVVKWAKRRFPARDQVYVREFGAL